MSSEGQTSHLLLDGYLTLGLVGQRYSWLNIPAHVTRWTCDNGPNSFHLGRHII